MVKKLVLIFLTFLLFGCNSDTSSVKPESVPEALIPFENLPEWLQVMLSEHDWSNDSYYWEQIHKGEWKNRTIYLYGSAYLSVFGYYLYEDGTGILLDPSTIEDINSTSKNWVLIWKHGNPPPLKMTKSGLSDLE